MSNAADKIIQNMVRYSNNPVGLHRAALQMLKEVSAGGYELVDPSNPFVQALEAAAMTTSAFLINNATNTRRQYPSAAQTVEDLYLHMSDRDYLDRFAIPCKTTFTLLASYDEVINKMVPIGNTGASKLVIPRNTTVTVADTVFSLQYPIEIRRARHGGISAVYDTDRPSPLQTLESNQLVLRDDLYNADRGRMISVEFEMYQMKVTSTMGTLNLTTAFSTKIALTEQFYYARVYTRNAQGIWDEIRTTHTDQMYDARVPTACLRVGDNELTVSIPQVYVRAGLLSANLRIDVYQTKGPIDIDLGSYQLNDFIAQFLTLDGASDPNTRYSAPLSTFQLLGVFSDQRAVGGMPAISFETLRARVMKNAMGPQVVPITNVQIETSLEKAGYEVVKNIDNITNRVFLATRSLPAPTTGETLTGASASIEMLSTRLSDLVAMDSVIDNGDRITLTPNTLFQTVRGVLQVVPNGVIAGIQNMPVDVRALAVTDGQFLYTPFYYVFDTTAQEFSSRAYHLDTPRVVSKSFEGENDTTLLSMGSGTFSLVRNATGYAFQLITTSSEDVKNLPDDELFVQMAFKAPGEAVYSYLMGEFVGRTDSNERIYAFDLSTNFDINVKHELYLTKFMQFIIEATKTPTLLTQAFDIFYATNTPMGDSWEISEMDPQLGRFLLPNNTVAISQERFVFEFGHALDTLWSRARSVVGSMPYETWEVNVQRIYEENVYKKDAQGNIVVVNPDGSIGIELLHAKGSLVFNPDGTPDWLHVKGSVKKDAYGQPIPAGPRTMLRQLELMLIEGVYYFATDTLAVAYRKSLVSTLVSWLINDIAGMNKRLLEQSRIYFYPKSTLGDIEVMVLNGLTTTIASGQHFKVRLSVDGRVYRNASLRARLTTLTTSVIIAGLADVSVSMSKIVKALVDAYGEDVIDVQISGLGGDQNIDTLVVIDESSRCGVRKRAVALPDGTLALQEDVTVEFIEHELL